MVYLFIGIGLGFAYLLWSAPELDDDGNIIKPGKKLSDLFKSNKR